MDRTEGNNGAQVRTGTEYLDALSKSLGSNRDTEGLGAMAIAGGGLIIGSVDAINGQDGEEMEFPVTKHELRALAAHWWTERLDHDFDWFVYQQTGSSEWRWSVYITRRLNRLGQILGEEAMDKAFDDAAARWRKLYKIDDEDWRVFTEGTEEQQEAWREKKLAEVAQPEGKALAEAFGAEDAAKAEETNSSAIFKCSTCGIVLGGGTKYVWQGKNRWCEKCFWCEDSEGDIANVPAISDSIEKGEKDTER
jgi:hypothetical protein